ncbi:MAG TPA: ABC transporter ATP-binding protein [Thiopseudomonas sp.]|nr:ABC transporter ATP-binding protein [Thiopseudomonas sp.]
MSSEIAIEVRNISKFYATYNSSIKRVASLLLGKKGKTADSFYALSDISFTVHKGETLGIIGSNGAGKSTLLQVICGTLHPSAGSVSVQGKLAALLELGAGFNPEFTGRENVYLSAAVYGLTREQIDARLAKILNFAEIDDFIDKPVKTYSSGMFVRLAFAIIAHVDAEILVIDEALAVGDVYFTQKCMRFLKDFAERGTLLFVSHDTTTVVNLCDRAVWLEKGQLRKVGSAREVSEAYLSSVYENKLPEKVTLTTKDADEGDEAIAFESAQFGVGGGRVLSCRLLDREGGTLHLLDRAQDVVLQVRVEALQAIEKPIVGFFIKNRLGQHVFGKNTIELRPDWQQMADGEVCEVCFMFHMPLLATGDYSVGVALAAGTQAEHVQHHWIHDALAFKAKADPFLAGFMEIDVTATVK